MISHQDLVVAFARDDFIEHEGHLSMVGVATLAEAGLDVDHYENLFTSEGHNYGS